MTLKHRRGTATGGPAHAEAVSHALTPAEPAGDRARRGVLACGRTGWSDERWAGAERPSAELDAATLGIRVSPALVWISGASSGIGHALAAAVPWEGARVIDVSRRGSQGREHVEANLSDPAAWAVVAESFRRELEGFSGEAAVFVHAAGTLAPMGHAGEVDGEAYTRNVLLNSAAPQALGHSFLSAAAGRDGMRRHIVMLTSGAAGSVYPGWSSYGAGKAAVDQWVRNVGAEQDRRGGVHVIAVTPGTVDTDMQREIRATSDEDFPSRAKFVDLHEGGELAPPDRVAREIWSLLDSDLDNGSVVDLRERSGDTD